MRVEIGKKIIAPLDSSRFGSLTGPVFRKNHSMHNLLGFREHKVGQKHQIAYRPMSFCTTFCFPIGETLVSR